jgi:NAD(P)-dependent dehydrogenase (short-subunit alcohol dehydrogenase family)
MSTSSQATAVVTGGRRGIGRGIAYSLAEHGWNVVVLDLVDDEATQVTLDGIRTRGGRAAFVLCDVAEVERAGDAYKQALAAFGRIDSLVNNAGVQVQDRNADFLSTTVESFDRLVNVNLRGTFFLAQAFARGMLAQGSSDGAFRSVITVSSSNATHAKTCGAEYCISKSGVSMLNKVLALQLAPHGIACYEVQPGLIKTDMNASVHALYDPVVAEGLSPQPRWGYAEDVGRVVATAANGGLPFCTGETLHVDGGLHIPKSPFESPFLKARMAR